MAVVEVLNRITDWARDNICAKVKLKLPDDKRTDASYNAVYELVNPAAFALYVPTKDKTMPKVAAPVPSLCVQLITGKDDLIRSRGSMEIRFCFAAWNPGEHGPDVFLTTATPNTFVRWNTPEAMEHYQRRGDGWQDAWNFVDTALRVLESSETAGEYRIVKEDGISFGPAQEQDSIPDYYPFWFAWVSFRVEYGIARNRDIEQLL